MATTDTDTERTPLLPSTNENINHVIPQSNQEQQSWISINDLVASVSASTPYQLTLSAVNRAIPQSASPGEQHALIVIIICRLFEDYSSSRRAGSLSNQILNCEPLRQRKEASLRVLNEALDELQNSIADIDSSDNTAKCMHSFLLEPFSEDGKRLPSLRVVDLLSRHDFRASMLERDVIILSLLDIWWNGTHELGVTRFNSFNILLRRASSPRIAHAYALVFHLLYLVLLVRYTIAPFDNHIGTKIYALVFGLTSLTRVTSRSCIPFLLVVISFGMRMLNLIVEMACLTAILTAVFWHVLQLHMVGNPALPSPLLLMSPENILPISCCLQNTWAKAVAPAILLGFPMFFISFWLTAAFTSIPPSLQLFSSGSPPPQVTQNFFLVFLSFSLVFITVVAFSLSLPAALGIQSASGTPWESHGEQMGKKAREKFASLVASWSDLSSRLPPPFGLIRWGLLIASRLIHRQTTLRNVEFGIWVMLVAPLAITISVLWIWS